MRLPAHAIEHLLDTAPVARLVTLDPDGAPAPVPIVFVRLAGRIWSPIDGKPKSGRPLARVRNVRADPRVSLLVDAYTEDWARLWWIRVRAEAHVVRGASAEGGTARDALRQKYPQYADVPLRGPRDEMLVLSPRSTQSWAASPETWRA